MLAICEIDFDPTRDTSFKSIEKGKIICRGLASLDEALRYLNPVFSAYTNTFIVFDEEKEQPIAMCGFKNETLFLVMDMESKTGKWYDESMNEIGDE